MILFLLSSLRSGSHMVRSMLRHDTSILDNRAEHSPLADGETHQSRDVLVPLKYGYGGFTADCMAVNAYSDACALVLHRLDFVAQALSLAHARTNGTWFGPTGRDVRVVVSREEATALARRNADDLAMLRASLTIKHRVLAYEYITVDSVKATVDELLQRSVVVSEPATVKLSGGY